MRASPLCFYAMSQLFPFAQTRNESKKVFTNLKLLQLGYFCRAPSSFRIKVLHKLLFEANSTITATTGGTIGFNAWHYSVSHLTSFFLLTCFYTNVCLLCVFLFYDRITMLNLVPSTKQDVLFCLLHLLYLRGSVLGSLVLCSPFLPPRLLIFGTKVHNIPTEKAKRFYVCKRRQ